MAHLNIEIKARCAHPEKIETILRGLQARFIGVDNQIDTYFKVHHGRLKLREGNIENALIFYARPNQSGPKASEILLYPHKPDSALKDILLQTQDVLVVVDKSRQIYFIENVKFHIDSVKGLGSFVEIEAIDSDGSIGKEKLLEQCQYYMALFEIVESDFCTHSYSDMLTEGGN